MPRDLQTSPEPQTLRAPDDLARRLLAFCRGTPAEEEYQADNPDTCALAQFGFPDLLEADCGGRSVPLKVYDAAVYGWPVNVATFGALTLRLEALSARAGEEVARG